MVYFPHGRSYIGGLPKGTWGAIVKHDHTVLDIISVGVIRTTFEAFFVCSMYMMRIKSITFMFMLAYMFAFLRDNVVVETYYRLVII